MPAHDLSGEFGRAVRAGILALGFLVVTVPAVADPREGAVKAGDKAGLSGPRAGAKADAGKAAPDTTAGFRVFGGLGIGRDATRPGAGAGSPRVNAKATAAMRAASQRMGGGPKATLPTAPAKAAARGPAGFGSNTSSGATGPAGLGSEAFASGSIGADNNNSGGAPGAGASSGQGAREGSDIWSAFETLTRPQQARVMQRCKEMVARPALADPNHLTICQTLMAMAGR